MVPGLKFHHCFMAGTGGNEGLPFRLKDDLSLVMNSEKKLIPLADYFHQLATIHGVATFELSDHTLLAKQHVPAT